jgi:hypothetical protein
MRLRISTVPSVIGSNSGASVVAVGIELVMTIGLSSDDVGSAVNVAGNEFITRGGIKPRHKVLGAPSYRPRPTPVFALEGRKSPLLSDQHIHTGVAQRVGKRPSPKRNPCWPLGLNQLGSIVDDLRSQFCCSCCSFNDSPRAWDHSSHFVGRLRFTLRVPNPSPTDPLRELWAVIVHKL